MIQNGNGIFIEKQSNRVTVWDLSLNSSVYRVVYDKDRKRIVTVLPPNN